LLNALQRFGGYTLATLLAEDAELHQLMLIEERGTPRDDDSS
jgi:hypothetical protein